MQPGLTRAVPVGILAFLVGVALVTLIRAMQSMDPLWDPQLALVLAGFLSTFAFTWGMGALDPKMNEHAHEPEEDVDAETALVLAFSDHHDHEEEIEERSILSGYVWQVFFWSIVLFLVIGAVAAIPGWLSLTVSEDAGANTNAVGFYEMDLFGTTYVVSQLTTFLIITFFTMFSLFVIGGLIALTFRGLSQNVTEARSSDGEAFAYAPLPDASSPLRLLYLLVRFVVVFVVLYVIFYYVAIGLILPQPEVQRVGLSLVNALLFAIIILHPVLLLRYLGKLAGWVAYVLRGIPSFLGQK